MHSDFIVKKYCPAILILIFCYLNPSSIENTAASKAPPAEDTTSSDEANKTKAVNPQQESKQKKQKKVESGYYESIEESGYSHNSGDKSGYYESFNQKLRSVKPSIQNTSALTAPTTSVPVVKPQAEVPAVTTPTSSPKVNLPQPVQPPITTPKGFRDEIGPTGSITVTRHANKARAAFEQGQYAQAKPHYREAMRLSPETLEFAIGYYKSCLNSNDWSEAARTLEKIIKANPKEEPDLLADYGRALFQLGQFDKASSVLKKSLTLGKNSEAVHSILLKLRLAEGNHPAAANEYRAVLKSNNNDAALHLEFAEFLWRNENLAEAVVHFRAATKIKPNDAAMQDRLGYALLYAKDYVGSVAAYKKAAQLNPSYPRIQESLNFATQQLQAAQQQTKAREQQVK